MANHYYSYLLPQQEIRERAAAGGAQTSAAEPNLRPGGLSNYQIPKLPTTTTTTSTNPTSSTATSSTATTTTTTTTTSTTTTTTTSTALVVSGAGADLFGPEPQVPILDKISEAVAETEQQAQTGTVVQKANYKRVVIQQEVDTSAVKVPEAP